MNAPPRLLNFTAVAFLLLIVASSAVGGHVEHRDGKIIFHVTVFDLSDPGNTDAANRANVTTVREFERQFPRIFAQHYRERYKADLWKYGDYTHSR